VDVVIIEMDEECFGWWDSPGRTIYLARGLTQRQRRAVLAHECEHASHDDKPLLDAVLNARRERATDIAAARRLIPIDLFIEALRWTGNERELADELWVDVHTIRVRFASLTATERARIDRALSA
jgi:phosphatidylserine/phosphatidylglycerophosphate/cardiolipin synthase-like enzyme